MSEICIPEPCPTLVAALLAEIAELPDGDPERAVNLLQIAALMSDQSANHGAHQNTNWQQRVAKSFGAHIARISIPLAEKLLDPTERLGTWRALGVSEAQDFFACIAVALLYRTDDPLLGELYAKRPMCTENSIKAARRKTLVIVKEWLSRQAPAAGLFAEPEGFSEAEAKRVSTIVQSLAARLILLLALPRLPAHPQNQLHPLTTVPLPANISDIEICARLAKGVLFALLADVWWLESAQQHGAPPPLPRPPRSPLATRSRLSDLYDSEELSHILRNVAEELSQPDATIGSGARTTLRRSYALCCFAVQCFSFRVEHHLRLEQSDPKSMRDKSLDRRAFADALRPLVQRDPHLGPQLASALGVLSTAAGNGRWGDAYDAALTNTVRKVLAAEGQAVDPAKQHWNYRSHIANNLRALSLASFPGADAISVDPQALADDPWGVGVRLWLAVASCTKRLADSRYSRTRYQGVLVRLQILRESIERLLSLKRAQSLSILFDLLLADIQGALSASTLQDTVALLLSKTQTKSLKALSDTLRRIANTGSQPTAEPTATAKAAELSALRMAYETVFHRIPLDLRRYRIEPGFALYATIRKGPPTRLDKLAKGFFTQMYAADSELGARTLPHAEWEFFARCIAEAHEPYRRVWELVHAHSPLPEHHSLGSLYQCLRDNTPMVETVQAALSACCASAEVGEQS